MAKTVLCYRVGRPESLVRVDIDVYNADVAKAEENDQESPWILADEDAESTAKSFDQLTKAQQADVKKAQKKRAAAKAKAKE